MAEDPIRLEHSTLHLTISLPKSRNLSKRISNGKQVPSLKAATVSPHFRGEPYLSRAQVFDVKKCPKLLFLFINTNKSVWDKTP